MEDGIISAMKLASIGVKGVLVAIFVIGNVYVWNEMGSNSTMLKNVQISINDVKNSISELRSTVASLARDATVEQHNIAKLQD